LESRSFLNDGVVFYAAWKREKREAGKRLGVRIHTKKLGDKVIISTKNYKGHKYVTDYVNFDDGVVWKVNSLVNLEV